ncbi:hypothetical protein DFH09DRAFT_1489852 [Mycena vulgaris]|nr:hypothetical protein DFH09DRAFT_1489852 [Mycena vulgaris]
MSAEEYRRGCGTGEREGMNVNTYCSSPLGRRAGECRDFGVVVFGCFGGWVFWWLWLGVLVVGPETGAEEYGGRSRSAQIDVPSARASGRGSGGEGAYTNYKSRADREITVAAERSGGDLGGRCRERKGKIADPALVGMICVLSGIRLAIELARSAECGAVRRVVHVLAVAVVEREVRSMYTCALMGLTRDRGVAGVNGYAKGILMYCISVASGFEEGAESRGGLTGGIWSAAAVICRQGRGGRCRAVERRRGGGSGERRQFGTAASGET